MLRKAVCAAALAVSFLLLLCLSACGGGDTALSETELAAVRDALGAGEDPRDITEDVLTDGLRETCDSVKKVYLSDDGHFIFFASPVGYNGPIDIMLVIDGANAETSALKIISHSETREYVRDFESGWFTGRFAGKSVFTYLERVKLDPVRENQIVAITGSTVTTDAVIDGVNDCFDVFRTIDNPYYAEQAGAIALTDAMGNSLGTLTLDELRTLDNYLRRLTIHSSSEGDSVHDFRGVRLYEAVSLIDPSLLSEYTGIIVTGSDGYESTLYMDEVLLENNVFIMYEDNGELMRTSGGQEGAMRLIVLSDDFGQRFTKFVTGLCFINERE